MTLAPRILALAFVLAALPAAAEERRGPPVADELPASWTESGLDAAAHIAVQHDGRVKPLSTVARFALLRVRHKRSYPRGGPTGWLLDTMLRPEAASRERVFQLENSDVIEAIGLDFEDRKRRDRYSYAELAPALARLMELGQEYAHKDAKKRTTLEGQVLQLAQALNEYEGYLSFLAFAREEVDVPEPLRDLFDGRASAPVSRVVEHLPQIVRERGRGGPPRPDHGAHHGAVGGPRAAAARTLLDTTFRRLEGARALALIPPADRSEKQWRTPLDLGFDAARGRATPEAQIAMLRDLEALAAARDPAEVETALRALRDHSEDLAGDRGEYDRIGLEVFYYRLAPFTKALVLYLLAFLLVAVLWFRPGSVWLRRAVLGALVVAVAFNVFGIVLRCILRGRPPVSTLYETVIFVTAVGVLAGLVIEYINRRRIALSVMPAFGALGMFLSMKQLELEKMDTMPQLQAVLDTNFWLATHVTCITIGYAAALLASALAHVHVLGRVAGLKRGNKSFYSTLAKMIYGVVCFALLFSVVGTILGGVWANESWGRFWGWDPKENGALMIVLSQLAILHARLGGYVRGHGIAMAAIFSGCIVVFSWWGVNLLGVGLHSYGFIQGIWNTLFTFYAIESAVLLVGGVHWLAQRRRAPAAS